MEIFSGDPPSPRTVSCSRQECPALAPRHAPSRPTPTVHAGLASPLDRRTTARGAVADSLAARPVHGCPARMTGTAETGDEQSIPPADERADPVVHQKSIGRLRGKGFSRGRRGRGGCRDLQSRPLEPLDEPPDEPPREPLDPELSFDSPEDRPPFSSEPRPPCDASPPLRATRTLVSSSAEAIPRRSFVPFSRSVMCYAGAGDSGGSCTRSHCTSLY